MRHLQLYHHCFHILTTFSCILVFLEVKVWKCQQVPSLWVFIVLRDYRVKYFYCIFKHLQFNEETRCCHSEFDRREVLLVFKDNFNCSSNTKTGFLIFRSDQSEVSHSLQGVYIFIIQFESLFKRFFAFYLSLGCITMNYIILEYHTIVDHS